MKQKEGHDSSFYHGGRKTHWAVVAFAMIGSCMSGVTFVSVPGMVGASGFGYLQMCIGFFLGYLVIAFVLTPLYFKLNVVSIYQYLENRFGLASYKTGAWFFFISKMLGASVRLFLVCLTLQLLVFGPLGLPFWLNVLCNVAVCLALTFRHGVKSVIGVDVVRTACMIVAGVLLRRREPPAILLETAPGRPVHGHRDDRPGPGHDAAHLGLQGLPRLAEEPRREQPPADGRHRRLPVPGLAPVPVRGRARHPRDRPRPATASSRPSPPAASCPPWWASSSSSAS